MKKTFYYNFFPTKAEEDAAKANNTQHQIGRALLEIRELYPKSQLDPIPWQIKKILTSGEVMAGKLLLLHNDTFDHIFRFWSLEMANHVVMGHKLPVVIWDLSDDKDPIRYCSEHIFLEKGSGDAYVLGFMELVRDRRISPGDEIGLYWETRSASFQLKLQRHGG